MHLIIEFQLFIASKQIPHRYNRFRFTTKRQIKTRHLNRPPIRIFTFQYEIFIQTKATSTCHMVEGSRLIRNNKNARISCPRASQIQERQ